MDIFRWKSEGPRLDSDAILDNNESLSPLPNNDDEGKIFTFAMNSSE